MYAYLIKWFPKRRRYFFVYLDLPKPPILSNGTISKGLLAGSKCNIKPNFFTLDWFFIHI